MSAQTPYYAPRYAVTINDEPIPAALRASISGVSYQTGLEGADRVELTLVNENLRWLDDRLLELDNKLTLALGYAPGPLRPLFVGEIMGQSASFPTSGVPTLTVVAQDRLARMQRGSKVRWFIVPTHCYGNVPLPDNVVATVVSRENLLVPIFDPISASLAILAGGAEVAAALRGDDPNAMEKLIRKQEGESDFQFLDRIAKENGWEMLIDHGGQQGGSKLRFMSPLIHLEPDLRLRYGRSLIDFSPRISDVGQVLGVTTRFWLPALKIEFTVSAAWDWERNSLDLSISPGFGGGLAGTEHTPQSLDQQIANARTDKERKRLQDYKDSLTGPNLTIVDQPVTLATAPRVILSKLIPTLNKRLTGTGSTIGDPRIKAGSLLALEGLGERFGGYYRVTAATHTLDGSGYRTSFEARKEVWFGSIPLYEQGAVRIDSQVLRRLGVA